MGNMNCPIMLEVKPDGAGWAEIKMHIGKDDYVFTVSYIGEDIHDLIEKVYYLYPDWGHDDHNNKVMEYYDDVEIESTIDGVDSQANLDGGSMENGAAMGRRRKLYEIENGAPGNN